jgi:hypothetical protein
MNRHTIQRAPLAASALLAGLLAGPLGCGTYHYMRDATPEIQRARQDYVLNNPGNGYNDDISLGHVRAGMSRLQVRVTWGDPDRVDLSTKPGSGEMWSYDETDASGGTSVYMLQFDGEALSFVQVDRSGALLPSSVETRQKKDTTHGDAGDPSKKPR